MPPEAVTLSAPLASLQVVFVLLCRDTVGPGISFKVMIVWSLQPLASVTVTAYKPDFKLMASAALRVGSCDHLKVSGAVPPVTDT